ncbi:MAG: sugar kinase [Oxalobacter sp.]|nr:sugar kinase [Oxalobacter sp.]
MSNDIICLGKSTLDLIWPVESLPGKGGKFIARDFIQLGGGMAATAAVAVSRLGRKVAFYGRAGDDAAGHAMLDELAGYGVDVSQFRLFPNARSSVSGILVDKEGERAIANFRGADIPDEAHWLDLDDVAQTHAVLVDVRWKEGAVSICAKARAHGIPTILDGEIADLDIYDALLPLVDHAIFSLPGLRSYGGAVTNHLQILQKVREQGCKVAAVTMGAQGCLWIDDNGVQHQAAFGVNVVDTTGAGDVFHGAYAVALAEGKNTVEAMRFASGVAALKCTHYGGRAGIPDREEVDAFLAEQFC